MDHPGGFATSPWAAVLGHHAAMGHGGEHPGFAGHSHHASHSHHHGHHGMPMDLHVPQGFPYYRYREDALCWTDRKPSMDDVGNPSSVNARLIQKSSSGLLNRTSHECSKKWNNLMDIYKKMKDPKTGTAPSPINSSNWIFFSKINDIMGTKQNIAPTDVLESGTFIVDNEMDDIIEYDPGRVFRGK